MVQTLFDACTPRESVFSKNLSETVYRLDELATLDPGAFFEENFVTQGMKSLLTEVFSRLDGTNPEANGAFLLSQSMGGGKTHSLLALGLLAMHPQYRQPVMGSFANVAADKTHKVITFNGRENPEFGIWSHLAQQLGKSDVFAKFYQPLRAPGESNWIELLQGDNILILMDEIPPYLSQALGVKLGQLTLAHATQAALSNLLSAIGSGKLPNVTLVLTDLSGSSYEIVDSMINSMGKDDELQDKVLPVLRDMEKEAERTVQRIAPVRLDSPELYDILRTRLFATLPDAAAIDSIASAFRLAIEDAGKTLDVPTDRASDMQSAIRRTYPFHPAMQDVFARFRENQGYQQTRALIRIMRQVVADLWTSGQAEKRHLIGVHDVDPGSPRLASEIEKINDRFGNAIAHDIHKETGDAVAQVIDVPSDTSAQDAARLILMSSLSLATNPVLGLNRTEIVTYLASPTRSIGSLNGALDALIQQAWYIHATAQGRILFRDTENVRARLDSTVANVSGTDVIAEVRKRVLDLYKPIIRDVYQQVEALPDLKDVPNTADRTILVIARPESVSHVDHTDYYGSLQFKNRVIFVTGRQAEYEALENATRYLLAANAMVKDFQQKNFRGDDPQLLEANDLVSIYSNRFYQALQHAFFTIRTPSNSGLLTTEFDPKYGPHGFDGEKAIRETLIDRHQYITTDQMMEDSFRTRVEKQLWPHEMKTVSWQSIRTEAAQQAGFPLHHPGKLDDVRMQAVMHGHWRTQQDGKFVERGPFEAEKARVSAPRIIGKPDPETGEVTVEVSAINADQVTFVSSTGEERLVQGGQIKLKDLAGTFVAVDTTGKHASDAPTEWKNTITVRHQVIKDPDGRRVRLQAVPAAAMKYTINGDSPQNNGIAYTEPFTITDKATKVLVRAEQEGVSAPAEFNIPPDDGPIELIIDPDKPAVWHRTLRTASTGETFTLLEQLQKANARVHVDTLAAEQSTTYSSWGTDPHTILTVDQVRTIADHLAEWHTGWTIRAEFDAIHLQHGRDLETLLKDLETSLGPTELEQAS